MSGPTQRSTGAGARRWLLTGGALAALVAVASAPAAAQTGSATPAVDSFRSVVHIVGIATSGVLGYYAYRAREQFSGGVFATSATYTVVGAAGFALAFLNMELQHQFDVLLFAGLGRQGLLAVRMGLFALTVFAFGRAVSLVAGTLESWQFADS